MGHRLRSMHLGALTRVTFGVSEKIRGTFGGFL